MNYSYKRKYRDRNELKTCSLYVANFWSEFSVLYNGWGCCRSLKHLKIASSATVVWFLPLIHWSRSIVDVISKLLREAIEIWRWFDSIYSCQSEKRGTKKSYPKLCTFFFSPVEGHAKIWWMQTKIRRGQKRYNRGKNYVLEKAEVCW